MRVGIDLIEIDRIARAQARWGHRFLARVFTPREQADAAGSAASLAGRFAAKEATVKALGVGIGPVSWPEVEVAVGERGRPVLRLRGAAQGFAAELGLTQAEVSISDTKDHAVAVVILT